MLKSIDLNLNAGALKNAWLRLVRQIQTEVEHKRLTNASGSDMNRGDIVSLTSGDRQAVLAQGIGWDLVEWVGVMAEFTPNGERGIARTDGYAFVRFETGLGAIGNNSEGSRVVVSNSDAGAATIAPLSAGTEAALGVLADATMYSDENPYAWVILQPCCAPEESEQ
jgi:hypothetical protein